MTMGRNPIVWLGGAAMIVATATDTLAVIGRNLGAPVLGSIEIVQAAVLVSGTAALVLATLSDEHAKVKLITSRLGAGAGTVSRVFAALAATAVFAALAAGSIWIAADLWYGSERSELLGISWRALRLVANSGLVACAVLSLIAALRRKER
jgi:TRAP-type C4-dicarboxylate transport system permease small subunit